RNPVDRLRTARVRRRRAQRRAHDRRVRADRRACRGCPGARRRRNALLRRPGLTTRPPATATAFAKLPLDALGELDALLADIHDVPPEDPVIGLAAGIDRERLADLPLATGLVDVAVDREQWLVGLDQLAHRGRSDRAPQ